MSANWAERERDTNRLGRAIAKYLFENDQVATEKLYALGKLTWITKSYEGEQPPLTLQARRYLLLAKHLE